MSEDPLNYYISETNSEVSEADNQLIDFDVVTAAIALEESIGICRLNKRGAAFLSPEERKLKKKRENAMNKAKHKQRNIERKQEAIVALNGVINTLNDENINVIDVETIIIEINKCISAIQSINHY
jgi:hypothetical protein